MGCTVVSQQGFEPGSLVWRAGSLPIKQSGQAEVVEVQPQELVRSSYTVPGRYNTINCTTGKLTKICFNYGRLEYSLCAFKKVTRVYLTYEVIRVTSDKAVTKL